MPLLLRVVRLSHRSLGRLVAANVCQLGATAADLGLLALLRRFVDGSLGPPAPPGALGRLAGLAVALTLARAGAAYAGSRIALGASAALVADLQDRLFAHIHGLSLEFFHRLRPGDLAARLFHDAEAAARLVTSAAAAALDAPLRLAALLAVVAALDPPLAGALVLVVVPGAVVARWLARRLRSRFDALYAGLGALYDAAHESFGAAELLKTLGREADEVSGFVARNRALVAEEAALAGLRALEAPLGHGLRLLALVVALVYGSRQVADGRLTPGALAAWLVAAYAFVAAVDGLVSLAAAAQAGLAAAARVFAVLDEVPSVVPPAAGVAAVFADALRLENVTFAYAGRRPCLEGVTLAIRRGERVGIVGPSGGGKTTLLRLVLRLVDPTRGRVSLDGVDLRELDLASLRGLFAVVPQEAPLLDRSLRDNVSCARPQASAADLAVAAQLAGLDAVAARLPQGEATRVGPRGVLLSAGERQRVGLARAFLRGAPVLILDEAWSALDAGAEREIEAALAALPRGSTLIVVSHRLSALRHLDRIVVLDAGRIVEAGSEAELLARRGVYHRLREAQEMRPMLSSDQSR